jgi:lipopolysaccharide export system protein LptA
VQKRYILVFILQCIVVFGFAQKTARVEIVSANSLEYDQRATGKVKKLIGNVQLKQEKTLLFCDSAYLFEETNYVEAYRNVRINHNDSVYLYGDMLKYNGNDKIARLEKNVRMNDKNMTLTCNELDFDMNANKANYTSGGKIVSTQNTLTSQVGYYFTNSKEFYYRKNVVLTNPDYTMTCDTLRYNTASRTSYFYGPTTIVSDSDRIYCENGWYNTEKEVAQFTKNAEITSKSSKLKADSIYYERKVQFGRANRNIELTDTTNKIVVYGDYAELIGKEKRSFVTLHAVAKKLLENDSMYLFADTIFSYQKTEQQKQLVKAYYHAKVLKTDIQAVCDSLVYNNDDSTITLYHDPVMWSGQNQITSDTIVLFMNNNKLDSFDLDNNAFVISREGAKEYNQVKGKNMKGYVKENKISYIRVFGNGQSIYYANEDSAYIGVNVVNCSEMEFYFNNNRIDKGKFITSPDAIFYTLDEMKPEELRLKGFKWLNKRRPTLKWIR